MYHVIFTLYVSQDCNTLCISEILYRLVLLITTYLCTFFNLVIKGMNGTVATDVVSPPPHVEVPATTHM